MSRHTAHSRYTCRTCKKMFTHRPYTRQVYLRTGIYDKDGWKGPFNPGVPPPPFLCTPELLKKAWEKNIYSDDSEKLLEATFVFCTQECIYNRPYEPQHYIERT